MLKGGVIITPALRLGDFVHHIGSKRSVSIGVRSNLFTLLLRKKQGRILLQKIISKELAMVNWNMTVPVPCGRSVNVIGNGRHSCKWLLQCDNLF